MSEQNRHNGAFQSIFKSSALPQDDTDISADVFTTADEPQQTGYTSLKSFIQNHLNREQVLSTTEDTLEDDTADNFDDDITYEALMSGTPRLTNENTGYRLNEIDTECNAGIEHYLPTVVFRLRVMQERLTKEVAALAQELQNYQCLRQPSAETQEKITQLTLRLETAKLHQQQVDIQLNELMASQSFGFKVTHQFSGWLAPFGYLNQQLKQLLDLSLWLRRIDPTRERLYHTCQQLETLNQVLENGLENAYTPKTEITDVLTQYEQTLTEIEHLKEALKQPFFKRLFFR